MAATKRRKLLIVYPDFAENRAGTQLKGSYSEGIASISAVCKQGGHDVALWHMTGMVSKDECVSAIAKHAPDIVAFSTWTNAYPFVKQMLKWVKEEFAVFTLCGGYHTTLCPEEVIVNEDVDAVCIGEGEYPTLEICDNLDDKELLYQTQSVWFRAGGEIIRNPVRPFIADLDSLPVPDMELFDFDRFLSSKIKTAIVMVSRGCIFSCTYCANAQMKAIYPNGANYARFKGPQKAVDYLKLILEKYPYIGYFNFMDSILNMKKKWFEEFIALYARQLAVPFYCRLRLDLLDEDIVRMLKEAGCCLVDIGIESGDYELRKNYLKRNMTDDTIMRAFTYFRKYKIPTLTFNMVGIPYEDIKLTLKTVKLNARIRPNKLVVSIFYPLQSTELANIAREAGFITESTDMHREVVCRQPQYPEKQVLFAQHYFKIYVWWYKRAFALPKPLGKPLEKLLDFMFTTKYKPHTLLVFFHKLWVLFYNGVKRVVMKLSPRLYISLKDRVLRLKKSERGKA
ncbi:MAG: B12-binding domain-containing radical SAM protein [Oscillospiraceae bacterium]|jgi:radical SAM superfamily enzyme YgiQ (UPF0313 family)|nr:B12-binding domain-containing radical SAM protein [Oscillospiraceae bacterium]